MWPTFSDGDTLIFAHLLDQHHVDAGVVVLAKHPLKLDVLVVKRVHSVEPDGRFFFGWRPTGPPWFGRFPQLRPSSPLSHCWLSLGVTV